MSGSPLGVILVSAVVVLLLIFAGQALMSQIQKPGRILECQDVCVKNNQSFVKYESKTCYCEGGDRYETYSLG